MRYEILGAVNGLWYSGLWRPVHSYMGCFASIFRASISHFFMSFRLSKFISLSFLPLLSSFSPYLLHLSLSFSVATRRTALRNSYGAFVVKVQLLVVMSVLKTNAQSILSGKLPYLFLKSRELNVMCHGGSWVPLLSERHPSSSIIFQPGFRFRPGNAVMNASLYS